MDENQDHGRADELTAPSADAEEALPNAYGRQSRSCTQRHTSTAKTMRE